MDSLKSNKCERLTEGENTHKTRFIKLELFKVGIYMFMYEAPIIVVHVSVDLL